MAQIHAFSSVAQQVSCGAGTPFTATRQDMHSKRRPFAACTRDGSLYLHAARVITLQPLPRCGRLVALQCLFASYYRPAGRAAPSSWAR